MTLTDIPLGWVAVGTVLLTGALAAVLVRTRTRKQEAPEAAGTDTAKGGAGGSGSGIGLGIGGIGDGSWERAEERRRRKETLYATAAYLLLFCCAAVAAALSFHGLVGFGQQNLRLSGGWEYLVPFGLDGAAMFSAMIAVREASHGDASLGSRMLVWAFAGAAAWFNWVHAPRGVDHAGAPQFFAGMSLSAAILFDRALKQTRRAALREQGLVPRPLPQIRVVRWLRAPRETFRAWSLMLLEGVRTLDEAVDEVRDDRRQQEQERLRRREQQKLDRARVKALNRQHRVWGRGGATAVAPAAPSAGQLEAPAPRPALERGVDGAGRAAGESAETDVDAVGRRAHDSGSASRASSGLPPRTGSPAASRSGDAYRGGDGGTGGARDTADGGEGAGGAASPRLDSLEEKLAEIERQFG